MILCPGAIHIHSLHSDGTETIDKIAKAAKKAGLEWIIITDHNNLDGKEGIYHNVCVIVGEEISPENGDHYIALDIKTLISPDITPLEFIRQVKEQGGFGFIAHPDGKISRKNSYRTLRWQDWEMKDFGGIEIWNYMSNWVDTYHEKNHLKIIKSYLLRNNVLTGPTRRVLKWWDNLNNESRHIIPAIGGLDVHAFNIKRAFVKVKIFPYYNTFKTLTNIIPLGEKLPDDFESCKRIILDSLKTGKNIIINKAWGKKCVNPVFYIQNKNKKVYPGGVIKLDESSKLVVELPSKAVLKIICNGKTVFKKTVKNIEFKNLSKGKYRIEVYYKKHPWIFSNPVLVN